MLSDILVLQTIKNDTSDRIQRLRISDCLYVRKMDSKKRRLQEREMDIIRMIKNGEVTEADLLEYITDNDIDVAIAAAESDLATEPILDIAAHDKDRAVRKAAACNKNTGVKTLQYLSRDKDAEIADLSRQRLKGDRE